MLEPGMSHRPPSSTIRTKICVPRTLRAKRRHSGPSLVRLLWNRTWSQSSSSCVPQLPLILGPKIQGLWLTHTISTQMMMPSVPRPFTYLDRCNVTVFSLPLAVYLRPNSLHIYMLTVCILVLYNWIQAINYSPPPALSPPPKSSLSLPSVSLVEVPSVHGGWM